MTGLGALVRSFRQAAGLTQQELAERAGLSPALIRDLEQGRTRRPLSGSLAALTTALALNPAQAGDLERAAAGRGLWLQMLGPLAAWRDGMVVPLGGPAPRAVLGLLTLSPGVPLHRSAFIDVLWPDSPPANAIGLVQAHVSRLRRSLAPGRGPGDRGLLAGDGASYLLRAGSRQLDMLRFAQLVVDARAAALREDSHAACDLYQRALELWRGDPLADVALLRGHPAAAGLARQRAEATVEYARTASAAGWHHRVLPLVRELAAREPMNEQAHAQLMIALAGCGQQAEALTVYHDIRRRLDQELAMPPSQVLVDAHLLVLRQDITAAPDPDGDSTASPDRTSTDRTVRDRARAGPGPAWPAVPRLLPLATPFFTGRAAELSALRRRLLDTAAETVVIMAIGGTPGVGKSTLALRWAQQVADQFPDGQLYIDMRGYAAAADRVTPADAIRRFVGALGVPPAEWPARPDALQDLYRSLLARRRMLIVLDNARDAAQVRPLLPGGQSCAVLVTSRNSLTSLVALEGAQPLSLDVLTAPEARDLLARRLGPERVAAEPDAAIELVELCARLPLALAITAARAAVHPGLPLAALVVELRDVSGRLDALEAGEPASMRTVISWSYRQLPVPARRMFRLLGIHPGPDTTAAASASLAGVRLGQARETLSQLTEASLLTEHAPGRFRFHELLRAYAAECARAEDSQTHGRAAIHRVLDHYLHTAYSAALAIAPNRETIRLDPPQPGMAFEPITAYGPAMAWYEAEHWVLLAIEEQAVSTGFDRHAWQLPLCLTDFSDRRGYWHAHRAIQQAALAAARRLGDLEGQAMIHRWMGRSRARLGAYSESSRHYDRALRLYRQLDDRAGQARVHLGVGASYEQRGRYLEALRHCDQALRLYQAAGNRPWQAIAWNNIGWCHARLGDYQQALTCCRRAIELHTGLGDRHSEAHIWDSLGYICHRLGQHAESVSYYRRALTSFRELGDRFNEAVILGHLGDVHDDVGQLELAIDCWRQAVSILDELGHDSAGEMRARLQRTMPP